MEHTLFLVKKILGNLLMPVPVIILLFLWAFFLMLRRKTRWVGIVVVLVTTVTLFALSYSPLCNRYITQLESKIPTYEYNEQNRVSHIAVLGSWHQSDDNLPLTSQVAPSGVIRLTEGIRLYHLNPGSKLIFTGYKGLIEDDVSYPVKLRELAVALGVPEEDIIVFDGPKDTVGEARLIAEQFPQAKLALVTSAPHMPRALGLFRGANLDPIPAPTEHQGYAFKSWLVFPRASTLNKIEYWTHEGLGYIWAKLMGQVDDPE